jgi:2-polyprenyl-3-methyl-5-hydroxy-6-metoxy-1,4-benzoquinol methylase
LFPVNLKAVDTILEKVVLFTPERLEIATDMKEKTSENRKNETKGKASDQMRSLYDNAPYPSALAEEPPQGIPLLEHWVNGMYGFENPVLFNGSRILIAGCGSGEEAISFAQHYSASEVIGVDFSERSIEIAVQKAKEGKISNVSFQVADLTDESWTKDQTMFDFILCHGVADYVTDIDAMLRNFSISLKATGLIFLSVNTPHHPAGRVRKAMSSLGVPHDSFADSEDQRKKLVLTSQLLGEHTGIRNLASAPTGYLKIDIFPPIAHHLSIDEWIDRCKDVGLCFCGSMETLTGMMLLSDSQLFALYGFDKIELSKWMIKLRQPPGMQLLLGKKAPNKVPFDQAASLWNWKPQLAPSVVGIPVMTTAPDQPMHLTLQFPGLPNFVIFSNAYDLEVMRNCNGERSLLEIMESIPVKGNVEDLRSTLFRAFHYGILSS